MRALVTVVALALAACGSPRLSSTAGELVVESSELALPDAFVGFESQAALVVTNTSRSPRDATLSVTAPFALDADALRVTGGDGVTVPVHFRPVAEGPAEGALQLTSDGVTVVVALRATARLAPGCVTVDACRPSRFDPAAGACVETPLPDDTACQPASACLEQARCRAGTCVGTAKSCDDGNRCTADACSEESGCLHVDTSASCPAPSNPCQVATCDAALGCGVANAPDGTACGAADCVTANICLAGQCREVAVPDGVTCAPETPCQAQGVCRAQRCEQPAPAPLVPAWRYAVPDTRALYFNGLADAAGNLYWAECSAAPSCDLVSVTRNGFLRYRATLDAPARGWVDSTKKGQLVVVGGLVVASLSRDSVEARRAADGSLAWRANLLVAVGSGFPGDPPDTMSTGPLVDDGHGHLFVQASFFQSQGCIPFVHEVLLSLDAATGTVRWTRDFDGYVNALVSDEAGNAYAQGGVSLDGGARSGLVSFSSVGTPRWQGESAGGWALATAGGQLAAGDQLISAADGGVLLPPPLAPELLQLEAGAVEPLLAPDAAFALGTVTFTCCPTCPCPALRPMAELRSVRRADAWPLWRVSLSAGLPSEPQPIVSDGALTGDGDVLFAQGPGPLHVYQTGLPPEPPRLRAVTAAGTERFSCELPGTVLDGVAYGPAAALLPGRWVTVQREECFTCTRSPAPEILAFDVPGLDLAASGWPTTGGSNRRAGRPR